MKKRIRRFLVDGIGVYHCMTRIVAGEALMEDGMHRDVLMGMIRRVSEFCGVEVLTYALMKNHFHVLVEIDHQQDVDDAELIRRVGVLYGEDPSARLKELLEGADTERAEERRQQLKARMGNLSVFMKELKHRYSRWYNATHQRFGTLWAERFKSVLVQGRREALVTVAAYVELNAVRAGLVEDPENYSFSGLGQAVRGAAMEKKGVCRIMETYHWDQARKDFRVILMGKGVLGTNKSKPNCIPWEVAKPVLMSGEANSISELFQKPGEWLSNAKVVGTGDYVKGWKNKVRQEGTLSHTHKMGALPEALGSGLCVYANPPRDNE